TFIRRCRLVSTCKYTRRRHSSLWSPYLMAVTRRDFLTRIGQLGGYGAAFSFMQSLGLLPAMGVTHEVGKLHKVPGHGTTVVILGGGIAGLVSAYELGKLGYRCTLLEA